MHHQIRFLAGLDRKPVLLVGILKYAPLVPVSPHIIEMALNPTVDALIGIGDH